MLLTLLELPLDKWDAQKQGIADQFKRLFSTGPVLFDNLIPPEYQVKKNRICFIFWMDQFEAGQLLVDAVAALGISDEAHITCYCNGRAKKLFPAAAFGGRSKRNGAEAQKTSSNTAAIRSEQKVFSA